MVSRFKSVGRYLIITGVPWIKENYDIVSPDNKTAIALAKEKPAQTGWDRLYMMFTTDEFGEPSPQLVSISQAMMLSIVIGGGIGGFVYSRTSFLNFVETNDATKFTHHMDAKKKLQDKVTIGFGKGAFRWAWRLAAFTGMYTLITNTVSAYRGKSGILEHTIAGTTAGAVYKMSIGLRGIVVGGCLGGVLGTISGIATLGILKLSGLTMEECQRFNYDFKQKREGGFKQALEERFKKEDGPIAAEHDERVGNEILNLDNIKVDNTKPST